MSQAKQTSPYAHTHWFKLLRTFSCSLSMMRTHTQEYLVQGIAQPLAGPLLGVGANLPFLLQLYQLLAPHILLTRTHRWTFTAHSLAHFQCTHTHTGVPRARDRAAPCRAASRRGHEKSLPAPPYSAGLPRPHRVRWTPHRPGPKIRYGALPESVARLGFKSLLRIQDLAVTNCGNFSHAVRMVPEFGTVFFFAGLCVWVWVCAGACSHIHRL